MNVTGQQSLILAGERPPDDRGAAAGALTRVALPSGGAVLQRVTVVTGPSGDNVVMLRADYASPVALAPLTGTTYEGLAGRASANDPGMAQLPDDTAGRRPDGAGRGDRSLSSLPPAAQYALNRERGSTAASRKGSLIDVMA